MPDDLFNTYQRSLTGPATDAFYIYPSNTEDMDQVARAIYVGGDGNLTIITRDGTEVQLANVPAGVILPIAVRRVNAAGTTATGLIGLV